MSVALNPSRVGLLEPDQVLRVLTAATAAPSLHNSQPWKFVVSPSSIDVFADQDRGPQVSDPQHQAVRLACGAALMNLRLAIRALGILPEVRLLPDVADPTHLARVSCERRDGTDPLARGLAAAIPRRHTYRRPMLDVGVPEHLRARLRGAARQEQAWLVEFTTDQLSRVRDLLFESHRIQLADAAFMAEWRSWTGRAAPSSDGVPATAAGYRPEPQDAWLLRDFGGEAGRHRPAGRDFEADPLLVCVGTFVDGPHAQLQAGAALQRVLLEATSDAVSASFLSQLVEVPSVRSSLQQLIGGGLWPQAVLRLGYGGPGPATPRRPLEDVVNFRGPGDEAGERTEDR